MKKLSPWCLAAIATMVPLGAMSGITGALAAHAAILAVTLGIFVGTLSLGRTSASSPRGASAALSDSTALVSTAQMVEPPAPSAAPRPRLLA